MKKNNVFVIMTVFGMSLSACGGAGGSTGTQPLSGSYRVNMNSIKCGGASANFLDASTAITFTFSGAAGSIVRKTSTSEQSATFALSETMAKMITLSGFETKSAPPYAGVDYNDVLKFTYTTTDSVNVTFTNSGTADQIFCEGGTSSELKISKI
jgi:hypothetical protein